MSESVPPVGGPVPEQGFQFVPEDVRPGSFMRLERELLDELAGVDGLTPIVADVLDELGLSTVVEASVLEPRSGGVGVVGHAVTIRYLPARGAAGTVVTSGLATTAAIETSVRGDVLVVDASLAPTSSCLGGNAARSALAAGIGGVVVDGAIRDVGEVREVGLPVWSRAVTPRTGRWRLEAVAVNGPVACGGIQVRAGDVICADQSGVCVVPGDVGREVVERCLLALGRHG